MLKVSEIIEKRGLKKVLSLKGLAAFILSEGTEGQINRLAAKFSTAHSKSAIEARVSYELSDSERRATIESLEAIRDKMTLIIYDLKTN